MTNPTTPPIGIAITATDANKLANTPPASTTPGRTDQVPTTTPFTFTVTRSGDTTQAATINYSVAGSGNNPLPIADLVGGATGTLNFAAGQTSQTLTVNVGPHLTLAKPNDGFTVTVTDAAGHTASAAGNVQGVSSPTTGVLADIANAVYSPQIANVDGYTQLGESNPSNTTGLIEPASPNLGGTPNGFYAAAYQDGNQIVVAIRGTDPGNLSNFAINVLADKSWASSTPNATLTQDVALAAQFVANIKTAHPDATLTLTGHSLGGGIAQLLSDASGLSATTFNAPGAKQFEAALATQLKPVAGLNAGTPGSDTNYRVYGDQVSLAGTPIGQEITLTSPYGTNAIPGSVWAFAVPNHLMVPTVFSALNKPWTGAPDTPAASLLFPSHTASANVQVLAPTSVTAGQVDGEDPLGANTFTVAETSGSVPLSAISLPADPTDGITAYALSFLTGSTGGTLQDVSPGQSVSVPAGADGFTYTALGANDHPVTVTDDGIIGLTFGATGTFGDTITASNLPDTAQPFGVLGGLPSGSNFGLTDVTTGQTASTAGELYPGPLAGLQDQLIFDTPDNVNIAAKVPNVFLKSGAGEDALAASSGSNVLDGNTGSNFLVGASGSDGGADTFFTDARSNEAVWNTLVNFHTGDSATLWGFVPGTSSWSWDGISGAAGYTGATLRADVHGTGTTDASITFAGISMAQAQGLQVSTGTAGGVPYLYIHNPGV